MSNARQWYRISAKADQPNAELHIYGPIGRSFWDDDAVSAKQFIDDLHALPKSTSALTLRINSLGGDVFDGIAIANALRAWLQAETGRTIETVVEGIAASAATLPAMAGTTRRIGDNALFMVHNPWTIEIGNAATMRKTAETLDAIRDGIVATYQWHSQLSAEELVALLDAETWMSADQAVENGFATEKVEGLAVAASIDSRAAAKLAIPAQFKARVDALLANAEPPTRPEQKTAAPPADVLRACREADCLDLAEDFIVKGTALADVQAGIATAKEQRQQSAARAQAITAACASAKCPDLAAGYIKGAMSLDDVKAHLVIITAGMDKAEIDAHLNPDDKTRSSSPAAFKVADIYAARNQRHTND